jgi:hypothetical protein
MPSTRALGRLTLARFGATIRNVVGEVLASMTE